MFSVDDSVMLTLGLAAYLIFAFSQDASAQKKLNAKRNIHITRPCVPWWKTKSHYPLSMLLSLPFVREGPSASTRTLHLCNLDPLPFQELQTELKDAIKTRLQVFTTMDSFSPFYRGKVYWAGKEGRCYQETPRITLSTCSSNALDWPFWQHSSSPTRSQLLICTIHSNPESLLIDASCRFSVSRIYLSVCISNKGAVVNQFPSNWPPRPLVDIRIKAPGIINLFLNCMVHFQVGSLKCDITRPKKDGKLWLGLH
jgi:hypothetical protein